MKIIKDIKSPNFTDRIITVEYLILHYSAAPLSRTLEILCDPAREVSAHLVIDTDGVVHELVECLSGRALRAWHAGNSRYQRVLDGREVVVDGFNDCSIGIELVNLNGNLFPYTDAQYSSLSALLAMLKPIYPPMSFPDSILGHEQIAGFRGKCDPGWCFDWKRFFQDCYPNHAAPARNPVCPLALVDRVKALVSAVGVGGTPEFYSAVSTLMEWGVAECNVGNRQG